jgi:RHS repeat-associated protein
MNLKIYLSVFSVLSIFGVSGQAIKFYAETPINTTVGGSSSYQYIHGNEILFTNGFQYFPTGTNSFETEIDENGGTPNISYNTSGINPRTNINTSNQVGTIVGTSNVNIVGQYTYSIPVFTSPGIGDLKPSISVEYVSGSPSGLLGYSWDLAGIATISRSGKTVYSDGVNGGITFTNSDYFMYNGQKLLTIIGSNGADGTTYGMEQEDLSRIISHESLSNGPKWFSITTKSGITMEIGKNEDSRLLNEGGTVFVWKISKVYDVNGNYINYSYRNLTNEIVIDKIEYTGNQNTGVGPTNTIEFYYSKKEDPEHKYASGQKVSSTLIVSSIKSKCEGQLVRSLDFTYKLDMSSKLIEVVEKVNGGSQKNSTVFTWESVDFSRQEEIEIPDNQNTVSDRILAKGDFNGDGLDDFVVDQFPSSTAITLSVLVSGGNGNFARYPVPGITLPRTKAGGGYFQPNISVIDFDNNGKSELYIKKYYAVVSNARQYTFPTFVFNGTGMVSITNAITNRVFRGLDESNPEYLDNASIVATDVDGDGVTEAAILNMNMPKHIFCDAIIEYNNSLPSAISTFIASVNPSYLACTYPIDFNGNGITDLCVRKDKQITIKELDPVTGTINIIFQSSNFVGVEDLVYWGDFNGDGNSDMIVKVFPVIQSEDSYFIVYFSNGKDALITNSSFTNSIWDAADIDRLEIYDFNNDSKSDIALVKGTAQISKDNWFIFVSDGNKLIPSDPPSIGPVPTKPLSYSEEGYDIVADYNGDGFLDIIGSDIYNNLRVTYFGPTGHKGGNIIQSVINGINLRKDISYNYLKVNNATGAYEHNTDPAFGCGVKNMPLLLATRVDTKHHNTNQSIGYTKYAYKDAAFDLDKKQFLGFRERTETYFKNSLQRKMFVSTSKYNTTYKTLYPYSNQTYLRNVLDLLEFNTYTYEFITRPGNRYWMRVKDESNANGLTGVITNRTYSYYTGTDELSGITESNGYNTLSKSFLYSQISVYPYWKLSIEEITQSNPQGSFYHENHYGYDTKGNLTSAEQFPYKAKQVTTTFTNNAYGLPEAITKSASGLQSQTTTLVYDPYYRFVVSETNPLGQKTERIYNSAYGAVTWEKLSDGLTRSYEIDKWGDVSVATNELGERQTQVKSWRNPNSSLKDCYALEVTKSGAPKLTTVFSILDEKKLEITQNDLGEEINIDYNFSADGYLSDRSLPYKTGESVQKISYTYDDYDRVKTVSDNANNITTTYTNSFPTVNVIVNAGGTITENITKEYNKDGTIKKVTDLSGEIKYTYNGAGQLVKTESPSGIITKSYDEYGREASMSDPSSGTLFYTYDAFGRLVYQKDATDNAFTYEYDKLDRLIKTIETATSKTSTISYTLAGNGQNKVLSMKDFDNGLKTFDYDEKNRVTGLKETVNGNEFTTRYDYSANKLSKITYPSNYAIKYLYNTVGAIYQMKEANSDKLLWELSEVNALNQPKKELLQNGLKQIKTYNNYYPFENKIVKSDNSSLFSNTFNFNTATGNLTSRKDNLSNMVLESFIYDNMNRLTADNLSYTDINGNPQQTNITVAYSSNGNIKSKSDVSDSEFQYDEYIPNAIGAILSPKSYIPSLQQEISYNNRKLVQSITENGKELTFTYGPDDMRKRTVLKNNGTQINEHYYIGDYEKEIKPTGTKHAHYIYSPYALLGIMITEAGTDKFYYASTDYLGTIQGLMTETGTIAEKFSVDAWGRKRNITNWATTGVTAGLLTNRCYTGHEHLEDFSLVNMNARMYDPVLGRMLTPDNYLQDPEYTQNYNRYSYVFNNPLKFTDPTGNIASLPNPSTNYLSNWDQASSFYDGTGGWTSILSPSASAFHEGSIGGAGGGGWWTVEMNETEGENSSEGGKDPKVTTKFGADGTTSEIYHYWSNGKSYMQPKYDIPGLGDAIINGEDVATLGATLVVKGGVRLAIIAAPLIFKGELIVGKVAYKTLAQLGLKDGMKISSSRALELGEQFLGKGYKELVPGSGRFVSSDGTRVFRMGVTDITGAHGGGPHINFETLIPNPTRPGKMMVGQNLHIYLTN